MRKGRFVPSVLVLLLAAAGLLAGCRSRTVNSVERAAPATQRCWVADTRVITDASLNKCAHIAAVNESKGPGGLLRIQVEVVNATNKQHVFAYRFEWFDAEGILIETPTSTAVTRQIEGGDSLFISGVAPNVQAKDFRLKLIESPR